MTKQIRISEKVHNVVRVHVAKSGVSIIKFADKALLAQIKTEKLVQKIMSGKKP